MLKYTLIIFLLFTCFNTAANFKFSGRVIDSQTNEPLLFANVSYDDGTKGTSTNSEGYFELTLPQGNYNFLVSFIGYKTELFDLQINGAIEKDIYLDPTGVLLQEVSIYSAPARTDSLQISNISLKSKQIEEISSIFPDVFRSIQMLPGINANNEFSAKFNVRGGNYDENLVLVNGQQVYEPFHIKEADNASVGIFNIDLMKKVTFISGGFSAQYGDRLSSVLNIEYREGSREQYSGSATLSLTNIDGYVEGPLSKNGSFLIGARKSYLEYVLSLIDVEETARPSFYDIQGVLTYDFSPGNKFQLNFIHAGDDFEEDPPFESVVLYSGQGSFNGNPIWVDETRDDDEKRNANYFSNMIDLKNTLILGSNLILKNSLSFYEQIDRDSRYEVGNYTLNFDYNGNHFLYSHYNSRRLYDLKIHTLEAKTEFDYRINPFHDINAGFSYININYDLKEIDEHVRNITQNIDRYPDTLTYTLYDNLNTADQHTNADSYKLAGYIENVFQISDQLLLNVGSRVDYFDFNKDLTISPRINAAYRFSSKTTLRAAWGFYYQAPVYRQIAYSFASDTNTQSQKAVHYILGVEHNFALDGTNNVNLKIEGYYKDYSNLISAERDDFGNIDYSRKNDTKGYAAGADFFIALNYDNFYSWLSYGLLFARENYKFDNIGEFPRYTDQRHTLSFVGNLELGSRWSLNLRVAYGSGYPFTPYNAVMNSETNQLEWIEGKRNSSTLPAYKRIDLRVTKGFTLWDFPAELFVDISNLANFKNIIGYRYRFDSNGIPFREEVELWPIIPSLGFTIKF